MAYTLPEQVEVLFVQTAAGMNYTNDRLTLKELAPTTLMFSDRPERITGHIASEEFVKSWDQGDDSFASDPPDAVLSVFHPNSVTDIVVVLREPELSDGSITYKVAVLDGEMPSQGGPSALFIDVIGRPLSPVSFAGMHRRDHRMARRVDRRL